MKDEKIIFNDYPPPPSSNHATRQFIDSKGKIRRVSSPEVKRYKVLCQRWLAFHKEECRQAHILLSDYDHIKVIVYVCMHNSKIHTKAGTIKKNDVSNRGKHLLDNISNAIGIDDSHFTSVMLEKMQIPDKVPEHAIIVMKPHKLRKFE